MRSLYAVDTPNELSSWEKNQQKYNSDEEQLRELNKDPKKNEKELVILYFNKYYQKWNEQINVGMLAMTYRAHSKTSKKYDIEVANIDMRTQVKMKRLITKYQEDLGISIINFNVTGIKFDFEGEDYYNPNLLNSCLGNHKYTKHLKEHILFREFLQRFKNNFKKNTTEQQIFDYYQTLIPNFDKDRCSTRYYNCDRYERLQHIFKDIKTLNEYLNDEKYNNKIFIRN